jgi:hypothetical protein
VLPAILDILGPIGSTLASAPPPLPQSPTIERWLFERPILAGVGFGAFALVAFFVLNRRGEARRGLLVGGILAIAAVAFAASGLLVETPRERLIRLSNELVDAVAAGQPDAAGAMLADDLVIAIGSTPVPGGGFARRALETFRDNVRVTEHVVTDESATLGAQPTSGASQFLVRATTDIGFATAWVRLNWRLDQSDDWKVYLIEVLRVNGQTPEGVGAAQFLNR